MKRAVRRRRARIVAIWLAFMLLSNILYYYIEQDIYYKRAEKDLLAQADIVVGEIWSIAENDFYSQNAASEMARAKLATLEAALESCDAIADAKPLLDDFARAADIEALAVYDRDGTLLYRSSEDIELDFDRDACVAALDAEGTDDGADSDSSDSYRQGMFAGDGGARLQSLDARGVRGRWVAVMKERESEARQQIRAYFDWRNVLQRIRIGSSGCLLAVAAGDDAGAVLSWRDGEAVGKPVEALDIRVEGGGAAASPDALLTALGDGDRVRQVRVAGTDYYAARVEIDGVLMLALLPTAEVDGGATEMAGILFLLTLLITGLFALYALFHVGDEEEALQSHGRFVWDKGLSFKLRARGILTVAFVLALSLLFSALSLYAETFSYCQAKVGNVVELLESNGEVCDTMKDWSAEEYLTKCRIAECVLAHTDMEKLDWRYLDALSEALGIRCIHLFDGDGRLTATNSTYDRVRIDGASPFRALLEGRPYLVDEVGVDPLSGEIAQKIGMALRDADNRLSGIIMLTADPLALRSIYENLGVDSAFEQICLTDGTVVLAVNDGSMEIETLAEVKDGRFETGLGDFDYTGYPVSVLGITEDRLRDNYNGSMLVLRNTYFASVRRSGEDYYLVMRPQITMSRDQLLPVAVAVANALAFVLLLVLCACVRSGKERREQREQSEPARGPTPLDKSPLRPLLEEDQSAIRAALLGKKNYGFEERWPGDGVKWRDKTLDEKCTALSGWIIVFALAGTIAEALISGQRSIWYYCITGHWDSGINLYSITSCVITVCILMLIRLVGHRLLYMIATAVSAKGETICHLVDSSLGYVLFIAGIFICLANIGVNTTALSLTGGVAGVVFGIGCQNIVADILAGIIMTFEGVVRVGDYVCYKGTYGSVISIGVRTTQIKRYADLTIVRNNEMKDFINMTTSNSDTRISIYLNIDLRENLERVEAVIARELPTIRENIERSADAKIGGLRYRGVSRINESGMSLSFIVFCQGWTYNRVMMGLNRELKLMCDRNGIRIALPQVEVHEAER